MYEYVLYNTDVNDISILYIIPHMYLIYFILYVDINNIEIIYIMSLYKLYIGG